MRKKRLNADRCMDRVWARWRGGMAGVSEPDDGESGPRLYTEFADWYPMLSSPSEFSEDSRIYLGLLTEALGSTPRTLLELGAGAGNTASHYKRLVQTTLVDRSSQMLAVSRRQNPECEHVEGDMRSLRLGGCSTRYWCTTPSST